MLIVDKSQNMLIGLISTFIHECGHIIAMTYKKHFIKEIKINFFSIDIVDSNRTVITYENDLLILVSGSAFNFIASLFCIILYYFTLFEMFKSAVYINLLIGVLNLIPISSLDGGQILYIFLNKYFSFNKTNILCDVISFIFLLPLSILGFIILLKSKYNFSLLFICCYLIYILLWKNDKQYF